MIIDNKTVSVVVPSFNAGKEFSDFIVALLCQKGLEPKDVLVIDSSSKDGTALRAKLAGFTVEEIPKEEFSHGGTRRWAVENIDSDFIVFLTQDAILATPDSLQKLVAGFSSENIAAVYGRQLAKKDTGIFGAFARSYNYPKESHVNKFADKDILGIKAAFFSDSFGAYRRSALLEIGNFDKTLNFGEDTITAGKLLLKGYEIAYAADALVYHAHDFSLMEEFLRYKETGKFHKAEKWLLEEFGKAEGEGFNFVKEEMEYLKENGKSYLIPLAIMRNAAKYMGYFVGRHF